MSASPARTFLFARIAHHGVAVRASAPGRRVALRTSPSTRCRRCPIVFSAAAGVTTCGSRTFRDFRDARRPAFGVNSLRRRVAALRVVVNSTGDVQDPSEEEPHHPQNLNISNSDDTKSKVTPLKPKGSHQLITFFRFAIVPDYEQELEEHRQFIAEHDLELRGRIYINQQGINAQMSGRGTDGEKYAKWVERRKHFNGMRISIYPVDEQAHPNLRLRYKPQIVQLEGGTAHLPVHDPEKRGTPLNPDEWHEKLGDVLAGADDAPLLLDVRNGYEWDVGHFQGAKRPVQESFRETVETNELGEIDGPLAGVDKTKPIMMYCTGGIRCDVYSTVLKEQGYENVYTLDGGVQAYFDQYGDKPDQRWDDQLFVFDSRLAMTPGGLPASELGEEAATLECHCCSQKRASAPHRNCPNVDCNRLFLVCQGCLSSIGGFCCAECGKASHVRPTLLQPGRYHKYAHYTEGEAVLRSERRGEGRRERRQRRRIRKKAEHAAKIASEVAEGTKPRELLRAVRVLEKALDDPEAFMKNQMGTGTLAARTRSIVKAAGLLTDSDGDSENDDNLPYARQRDVLRKAADAIARGNEPGVDLTALVEESETKTEVS